MNEPLKGSYSPMEMTIFKALRKQETATSSTLLPEVYPRKNERPINATIIINRAVTTLGIKLERNREVFRLKRTRRSPLRGMNNRIVKSRARAREDA